MDRKKHQINNESNKTNKKSTSSDKTNTEEDVEQSPSHRSFGFEIDHTNHLGN